MIDRVTFLLREVSVNRLAWLVLLLLVGLPHVHAAEADPENKKSHWAFQPLVRSHVPRSNRAGSAVDAFITARLSSAGLPAAPLADKATLIRRVSLDLVGLPPTPRQLRAFLRDTRPDAYDRLVDRLLASPHFGERWGRHWLDVVGFVDTVGFDIDAGLVLATDGKWRYRDYVVQEFNRGTPYDQFLLEQLAGDELFDRRQLKKYTDRHLRLLVATGFWRNAQDFSHEPESDIPLSYYKVLHDTVAIMSNSLLGLTVNCAQCHSHKFDPISHTDYYRMMSLLTTAYNPDSWLAVYPYRAQVKDRTLLDVTPHERKSIDAHNNKLQARINPLLKRKQEVMAAVKKRGGQPPAANLAAENRELQTLNARIAGLERQRKKYRKIQALFNVGKPPVDRLFNRGDFRTPGKVVKPGFLTVLSNDYTRSLLTQTAQGKRPRRRLAFARWLTDRRSPASALTARVFVNRVWQHLFGHGLVRTEDNFGVQGEAPTHPRLLDWLCLEFIDNGWKTKSLIRQLVTSSTYRQASHRSTSEHVRAAKVDPDNKLLWRMPLRRLESEVIRDTLLQVSGDLNRQLGGPPVRLQAKSDGKVIIAPGTTEVARRRRSIYLIGRRSFNLSLLTVFDQPQVAINCARRDASAVVLQSLTMLNDPFTQSRAKGLAKRVIAHKSKLSEQISVAFELALSRVASPVEVKVVADFLKKQAAAFRRAGRNPAAAKELALISFCHSLLNSSEFLYAP